MMRVLIALCAMGVSAWAQDPSATPPNAPATPTSFPTYSAPPADMPTQPTMPAMPSYPVPPKQGDFDAGGAVAFPSGPDAMGKYATYNWVAVDLKGKYNLLDFLEARADIPIALIHPDTLPMSAVEPKMFGGINAHLELKRQALPDESTVGLAVSLAYMHEGAMLLSDKDFPVYTGDFQPGVTAGAIARLKLSELLKISLLPVWVHQSGSNGALDALQLPASLVIKLADIVKVSADAGIFTGKGYSFAAKDDGRIYAGASLDVKLWKLLVHAGGGVANLLAGSGSMYPTIRDSLYVELNVKYVK